MEDTSTGWNDVPYRGGTSEDVATTEPNREATADQPTMPPRFRIQLNGYHGETSTDISIEGDDLDAMTNAAVRLCTEIRFPFQRHV